MEVGGQGGLVPCSGEGETGWSSTFRYLRGHLGNKDGRTQQMKGRRETGGEVQAKGGPGREKLLEPEARDVPEQGGGSERPVLPMLPVPTAPQSKL